MGYRRFRFSSYVVGGQGIGLRVVLPFAAIMSIICGIGLYLVLTMPYNGIIEGLKKLPDFSISSSGKITEPIYTEKVEKLTDEYNVIINTTIANIEEKEIPDTAFMYITSSKVYLQIGLFLSGIDWIPEKARTCPHNKFEPIDLQNVKQGTYNPNKELTRMLGMLKLFCFFIAVQMFFVILITFLVLWLHIWFFELFIKHGLTGGQLARLLTIPYCVLISIAIILGLLFKSWYSPWFLFMPYISFNVKLVALAIPFFGDLINVAYQSFSFPFLMKLCWIVGLPVLLIWYFMWVSTIALTRERQKELMKQMQPKTKQKNEEEEIVE